MKYFGKRSLSSVLAVISRIAWYVVLVGGIVLGLMFIAATVFSVFEDFLVAHPSINLSDKDIADLNSKDWLDFKALPLALKILIVPYGVFLLLVLLRIVRRARSIFENFRVDRIFSKENVSLFIRLGKLMLVFSIGTFDIPGILLSIFILMLSEIFKSGAFLQEEHDLTV